MTAFDEELRQRKFDNFQCSFAYDKPSNRVVKQLSHSRTLWPKTCLPLRCMR